MNTAPTRTRTSPASMWRRALERTARIPERPRRIFPTVIEELAASSPEAPALLSDRESFTYRQLAERSNQYSRWALDGGLARGDVVCLLMSNRPEYLAIWLGITRVGGVVALLNTNLSGPSLAHCVRVAQAKRVIVADEFHEPLVRALPELADEGKVWVQGEAPLDRFAGHPLNDRERRDVSLHDAALYIYTSGTTGLPKAARVSHSRVMQWSHWFAGMMDASPDDRLYNCLPMYHSVGGIVATGAPLVGGGSVVIRDGFSARQFWDDILRWDCTLFQYIGELCRYLLGTAPSFHETEHRIRMVCGNGLRPDVWTDFQERFRIPQILEFYAATEGSFSLYNAEGKPGAIGRIPPFLNHRFPLALVRYDHEKDEPAREAGKCLRCAPNETGEAIGRISTADQAGGRFEGYTDRAASEKKILRDVFETGDAWFRTGDLMRRDAQGFFYFVDRVGDTFRWKGENVATSEVAEVICTFPGVRAANVYGVAIPGTEGRAGMAAIAGPDNLDLAKLQSHLVDRLPGYAIPVFLRLVGELPITGTFKQPKHELVRDGYDPTTVTDAIYFNDPQAGSYVPLDQPLFKQIQTGQIRL